MSRIEVHLELPGGTQLLGDAHFTFRRNRLTAGFTYAPAYLARRDAYAVDPALPLVSGQFAVPRGLPGAFADAAPDRWGRNLIAKRLRAEAAEAGRPLPNLDDRDFLLGVSDETRQGALRFRTEPGGAFQHPAPDVPKLVALPALLRAAEAVARDETGNLDAIKTLLDAGTASLGGARPKASVRDGDRLLIAKFPHPSDGWNVMGWEMTALDLAESAGIVVPARQLAGVGGVSVLLLERFDRQGTGRRGYLSAMSLLEATDGEARDYVEIADVLPEFSAATDADLEELWRRVAFSVAIHNTDDHLRNHGFLREAGGWRLAPVFDVNPNPDPAARRVTTVGGADEPEDEVQALLMYAPAFGLTAARAGSILAEVADAARNWAAVARRNGVTEAEVNRFRPTLERAVTVVGDAAGRSGKVGE